MRKSLFITELDGVTYPKWEYDALVRAEQEAAEWAAESAAELAAERYFEERGYEDARAQEYFEAQMGILA